MVSSVVLLRNDHLLISCPLQNIIIFISRQLFASLLLFVANICITIQPSQAKPSHESSKICGKEITEDRCLFHLLDIFNLNFAFIFRVYGDHRQPEFMAEFLSADIYCRFWSELWWCAHSRSVHFIPFHFKICLAYNLLFLKCLITFWCATKSPSVAPNERTPFLKWVNNWNLDTFLKKQPQKKSAKEIADKI